MRKFFVPLCGALITASFLSSAATQKKLIEFGWDEPDTAFMRAHVAEMEQTPFDGCVFVAKYLKPGGQNTGEFYWESWGTNAFTEAQLSKSLEDLRATPFKKFTHNFLRFDVTPGNVDWFDDFGAILNNARLSAKLAREGKCAGILFDIEQYEAQLWKYHAQRHAAQKSWNDYAAQARLRGREVMKAFQSGYPGLTVFLTFGYTLPYVQLPRGQTNLQDVDYGLLAPFLDGMFDAAKGRRSIVDGCEVSYAYRDTKRFKETYQTARHDLLPIVGNKKNYDKALSVGFGIWMDNDWRKVGWDTNDFTKNFYTPQRFEASTREALKVADEYVWIYTESPHWWTGKGPSKLPREYSEALQRARGKRGQ